MHIYNTSTTSFRCSIGCNEMKGLYTHVPVPIYESCLALSYIALTVLFWFSVSFFPYITYQVGCCSGFSFNSSLFLYAFFIRYTSLHFFCDLQICNSHLKIKLLVFQQNITNIFFYEGCYTGL